MFRKNKKYGLQIANYCKREFRKSAFVQPSPIDHLLFQEHVTSSDGKKSIRLTSDIYMLFNQQRLDRMSRENLIAYFNDMSVSNSSFSSLKSRLSDDQLVSLVKSRYIQQPSELLSWSRYLNSLADTELRAIVAESQKQAEINKIAVGESSTAAPASSAE